MPIVIPSTWNGRIPRYILAHRRRIKAILSSTRSFEAARRTGAEAIHPGYGFLSENPLFAEACEAAGIEFIGPSADQMRAFGLKHTARQLAQAANVPLLPGTGLLPTLEAAMDAAAKIGYPLMLKSTAGGGGIGMRLCRSEQDLASAFEAVARISSASFGDSGLYLERFVERARHIEVQIFGDGKGGAISLGERDCSVQRRNQKVIEETPAPGLSSGARGQLFEAAVALCRSVNYRSAGTVEFVLDADSGECLFSRSEHEASGRTRSDGRGHRCRSG